MRYMDKFRTQHDDILRAMAEISERIKAKAEPATLRTLLSGLAGKVNFHLAMEDQALYPRLMESGDAAVKARATKFKDQMGDLGEVFTRYNARWQVSAIRGDAQGFADETRKVFGALAKRIERENAELYPLADQAS